MPANVGHEFKEAEKKFHLARTIEEKISALKEMLSKCPDHKGAEKLRAQLKQRLAKLKKLQEEEKKKAKKFKKLGIKKEGAARVCIVGVTNSGKSTLLAKLTNAKPLIADYPFTTTEPEIGTMDYKGIKIQVIEIPAIVEDFYYTQRGAEFLSIIRDSEAIVVTYTSEEDKKLVLDELEKNSIQKPIIFYTGQDVNELKEEIWKNLGLIYVYTKSPSKKEPDFPPIALKKGSTVEDLGKEIHKDFIKKFKFALVNGKSVKFPWQQVGLKHVLAEGDVVEFHIK